MKLPIKKIIFVCIAAVAIFFAITYFDKWDGAVAKSKTQGYDRQIAKFAKNPEEAAKRCPLMIKNLKSESAQLNPKADKNKISRNNKLVADCALTSKDFKTAISYYQKVIRSAPNYPLTYRLYAKALKGDGNLASALRYSHLAVQLNPDSFNNRLLEARILSEIGKVVPAIKAYQEALSLVPNRKMNKVRNELDSLIDQYNLDQMGR